jgi:hypothetical protein
MYSVDHEFPKLPQSLELVNQTVSIPQEPDKEMYTYKSVIEYVPMSRSMKDEFHNALNSYHDLRANERQHQEDLKTTKPNVATTAVAFVEKRDKFRGGSDMQSTLMGTSHQSKSVDGMSDA